VALEAWVIANSSVEIKEIEIDQLAAWLWLDTTDAAQAIQVGQAGRLRSPTGREYASRRPSQCLKRTA
jgi:hypothetical protein